MQIIREDIKMSQFGEIYLGGVFVAEDDVYMKTSPFYEIETNCAEQESRWRYNAISLSTGYFNLFSDDDMVKPCGKTCLTVK